MAVTKQKITITIDCNLYEAAKSKYPNVSGRINELLSMDLYGSDEKEELVERLHNLKLEEKSITKRICELEKEELKVQVDNSNRDEVIQWVNDVYERAGVVGLNMLEKKCKRCEVDFNEIKSMMDEAGVAYVKYAEPLKR